MSNNFHAYIGLDPRQPRTCFILPALRRRRMVQNRWGNSGPNLRPASPPETIWALVFVWYPQGSHFQSYMSLFQKYTTSKTMSLFERPSFNLCIALWPFPILQLSFVLAVVFFSKDLGEHRTKPTEVEETFELGKVPHHRRYAKWPFDAQHMLLGQNYDFGPKCETSRFFWGGQIGRWVCVCAGFLRMKKLMTMLCILVVFLCKVYRFIFPSWCVFLIFRVVGWDCRHLDH